MTTPTMTLHDLLYPLNQVMAKLNGASRLTNCPPDGKQGWEDVAHAMMLIDQARKELDGIYQEIDRLGLVAANT